MSERSTIKYYGQEMTFWPDGGWSTDRNAFAIVVKDPDGEPVLCLGVAAADILAELLMADVEDFIAEIKEALEEAGFVEVKQVRDGERMDCLVEAKRPS